MDEDEEYPRLDISSADITEPLIRSTSEGSVVLEPPKGCIQYRYVVAIMAFFGNFCCYALRVNLSVAMVAMVNQSAVAGGDVVNGSAECPVPITNQTEPDQDGEFVWNQATQGLILGSFFWGYIVTQIPGGWIATNYSGKWTYGLGVLCTGLLTLVTPLAARIGVWALILVRVLEGLGEGVTFPALSAILTRWCPPLERTQITTIAFVGTHVGTVVSMPVTGFLSKYGFAGGWPSAFYVFGVISIVWFICWCFLVYDGPDVHPTISREEKCYIEKSLGSFVPGKKDRKEISTPWCDIFCSLRLWAILVVHVCNNWGFYTLLTSLPQYMAEVLHFKITENSLLSALPYLVFACFGTPIAFLADAVRRRGLLSTTTVRKIANCLGLTLPAVFLISTGYVGCDRTIAVAMVVLSVGSAGFCFSGYQVNHMDIAPNHAGVLFGVTNAFGTIPGMLGPYVVGLLTNGKPTRGQWMIVFYITGCIYAFGAVFYLLFGTGVRQKWNDHGSLTETFKRKMSLRTLPGGDRSNFTAVRTDGGHRA